MQHEILITNDDGIESPALAALEAALTHLGRVTVVAPDRERSAASHCITVREAVVYQQIGANRFAVQGTPADCVIVALLRIMKSAPSLVISGVNRGLNVGDDILYSGTVAAATEAVLQGIPALAVSASGLGTPDYAPAVEVAARIAARVLEEGLPPDILLNVNYPADWNGEFRLTRQGRRMTPPANGQLTDCEAMSAGYVSICPLQINRTAHAHFEHFTRWMESETWLVSDPLPLRGCPPR
jgi:5'-nucleotidase